MQCEAATVSVVLHVCACSSKQSCGQLLSRRAASPTASATRCVCCGALGSWSGGSSPRLQCTPRACWHTRQLSQGATSSWYAERSCQQYVLSSVSTGHNGEDDLYISVMSLRCMYLANTVQPGLPMAAADKQDQMPWPRVEPGECLLCHSTAASWAAVCCRCLAAALARMLRQQPQCCQQTQCAGAASLQTGSTNHRHGCHMQQQPSGTRYGHGAVCQKHKGFPSAALS